MGRALVPGSVNTCEECFLGGSEAIQAEGMDADELKRNSASTRPLIDAFLCPFSILNSFRNQLQLELAECGRQISPVRGLTLPQRYVSNSPMYRGAVSNELAPLVGEASILDVGITRWASNPYIRGAWSYARVNSSVKERT